MADYAGSVAPRLAATGCFASLAREGVPRHIYRSKTTRLNGIGPPLASPSLSLRLSATLALLAPFGSHGALVKRSNGRNLIDLRAIRASRERGRERERDRPVSLRDPRRINRSIDIRKVCKIESCEFANEFKRIDAKYRDSLTFLSLSLSLITLKLQCDSETLMKRLLFMGKWFARPHNHSLLIFPARAPAIKLTGCVPRLHLTGP